MFHLLEVVDKLGHYDKLIDINMLDSREVL